MKEKENIPEERSKKLSGAKKSLDDIMKRIESFLPERSQVIHKHTVNGKVTRLPYRSKVAGIWFRDSR